MTIRDRIKELRRVPAKELLKNPKNWRVHPESQRSALAGLLDEVGIADAVLARETTDGLELIDGHLRADIDPETVWPVLVLDVDEKEADMILATHDPLAAMAEADGELLANLLAELESNNDGINELLNGLNDMLELEDEAPVDIVEDEVPDLPTEPTTKQGDLWILGEHRLLCGDSTNADQVQRLMEKTRVTCVFTDPPYGVAIGAKNRLLNSVQPSGRCLEDIKDDDATPDELKNTLLPAFVNLREHVMADDCTLFVSAPQGGELGMMMMMMQEACLKVRHVLIWKKNQPTFSLGRLDYDYQHEPILLTWMKRHKRPMNGEHRTSVWEIDRERKCDTHPTMKPVAIYANAYLNNSDDGDAVADIYSGSGTAFIAAEQLNRRCFGMEISPKYCDVIVARWEALTGKKAKRV